jgi:hypothetical protein
MSAVNVAFDGDVAYILTDTRAWRNGRFCEHVRKAHVFPHSGTVIAGRGPIPFTDLATKIVAPAESFDEAVDLLARKWLRDVVSLAIGFFVKRLARVMRPDRPKDRVNGYLAFELFIVGWSQREGCMKAVHAFSENYGPFKMSSADVYFAPALAPGENYYLPRSGRNDADAFPMALLKIMERQRQLSMEREGGEAIGGAAVLTVISPRGIVQRVLHRWPDKTGERFGAPAGEATLNASVQRRPAGG